MRKVLFILLIMSVTLEMFAQNIINVNNQATGVTTQYTTLQAAVTAAANGDIIYLYPSPISYGNATINKGLTIIGPGYLVQQNPSLQINTYVNNAILGDITYTTGSNDGIITGCDFNYLVLNGQTNVQITRNKIRDRIYLSNTNNILVSNCYFENQNGSIGTITDQNHFHLSANSNNNSLIIRNNIFGAYGQYTRLPAGGSNPFADNLYIGPNSSSTIENNVFRDLIGCHNSILRNNVFIASSNVYFPCISCNNQTTNGIIYLYANSNLFENNILVANQTGLGTTNIINVPEGNIFEGWPIQGSRTFDDRYILKSASPAIGAGVGGVDCGAFGGASPYKLSGIPFIPLVYQINAPSSGSAASGINVNVKVRASN